MVAETRSFLGDDGRSHETHVDSRSSSRGSVESEDVVYNAWIPEPPEDGFSDDDDDDDDDGTVGAGWVDRSSLVLKLRDPPPEIGTIGIVKVSQPPPSYFVRGNCRASALAASTCFVSNSGGKPSDSSFSTREPFEPRAKTWRSEMRDRQRQKESGDRRQRQTHEGVTSLRRCARAPEVFEKSMFMIYSGNRYLPSRERPNAKPNEDGDSVCLKCFRLFRSQHEATQSVLEKHARLCWGPQYFAPPPVAAASRIHTWLCSNLLDNPDIIVNSSALASACVLHPFAACCGRYCVQNSLEGTQESQMKDATSSAEYM